MRHRIREGVRIENQVFCAVPYGGHLYAALLVRGDKAGHSKMDVSWGSPSLRFCVRFLFVFARSNGSHAT
jgi:hypothetical protein